MIVRNSGNHIREDGAALSRALLAAQPETFHGAGDANLSQVIKKAGATRQNRTGDLLITKNTSRRPILTQSGKSQQKQGK